MSRQFLPEPHCAARLKRCISVLLRGLHPLAYSRGWVAAPKYTPVVGTVPAAKQCFYIQEIHHGI
jgi:hypothetical protein